MSRKNSVLGRAKALRQESICSRQSETGNKAVGVCDILDELDEAQEARAPGSCNSFTIIFLPFLIPLVSFHNASGASLVAQWYRFFLPMQVTWLRPLGGEDPSPGEGNGSPLQYS